MKKWLKQIYQKEQFNPSILGLFINPFYFARRGLYKGMRVLAPKLNGKLLDVGCGSKPYKNLCVNTYKYVGLEIDDGAARNNFMADVLYDGNKFPFENEKFDCVMSNEVFEHVFNPSGFLREINRVLKLSDSNGGGILLMTVPFVWDEHEQPYDYARYSSFGLKYILEQHGFKVIEHIKINNGLEVIFGLLNAYIYKKLCIKNFYVGQIVMLCIIAPINVLGVVISRILPRNNDLYLDNMILAKKIRNIGNGDV